MPESDDEQLFHDPVSFSVPPLKIAVGQVYNHLANRGLHDLGTVVVGSAAGGNAVPALPGWSLRPVAPEPGAVRAGVCVADARGTDAPRSALRTSVARPPAPRPVAQDSGGDDDLQESDVPVVLPRPPVAAVLPGRRLARSDPALGTNDDTEVALTACVLRCCGLPSGTVVGRSASSVTAHITGDPLSRSRAIFLRFGGAKRDAILWVSSRGGLMCSCFCGTQNAVLLSATSRSSDCRHTAVLKRCIARSGISVAKFRSRMRLGEGCADYARPMQFGSTVVWAVLYQSVYSIVSFTVGNVASCIAPGCRRFRGRCGHVKVARPLNAVHQATSGANVPSDVLSKSKMSKGAKAQRSPFLSAADEDEGIEQLVSDTVRGSDDNAEGSISRRTSRNMLPCAGEKADGEAWARTADWHGLYSARMSSVDGNKAADLAVMDQIMEVSCRLGHVHAKGKLLVESYCGSCGTKREERHAIVKEPATLYTHHPTAPVIPVCGPSVSHLLCLQCPHCLFWKFSGYRRALSFSYSDLLVWSGLSLSLDLRFAFLVALYSGRCWLLEVRQE